MREKKTPEPPPAHATRADVKFFRELDPESTEDMEDLEVRSLLEEAEADARSAQVYDKLLKDMGRLYAAHGAEAVQNCLRARGKALRRIFGASNGPELSEFNAMFMLPPEHLDGFLQSRFFGGRAYVCTGPSSWTDGGIATEIFEQRQQLGPHSTDPLTVFMTPREWDALLDEIAATYGSVVAFQISQWKIFEGMQVHVVPVVYAMRSPKVVQEGSQEFERLRKELERPRN